MKMDERAPWTLHTSTFWLIVGLLLLAFFLRIHQLVNLPPGLHHDEAVNGLDAWQTAISADFRIFYEANNGREPLHIYWQAVLLRAVGGHPFALRYASALIGTLAVAAFVPLLRVVSNRNRTILLLGVVQMALMFWGVLFSRIAFRGIYFVLLLSLTFYFYYKRSNGWRNALFAGLFWGISLYTYLPARFVPFIWIGAAGLDLLGSLWQRERVRYQPWLHIGIMLATGLLVAAPLLRYFAIHPAQFSTRSGQVSIVALAALNEQPLGSLLWAQIVTTLRMFIDQAHLNPVISFPSGAILTMPALIGFWVGVWYWLRTWRQRRSRLLLLWLVLMSLTSILSNEPAHPLRMIGMIPVVAITVAYGWHQLLGWINRPKIESALILLLLITLTIQNYRRYFVTWGSDPLLYELFDVREFVGGRIVATRTGPTLGAIDFLDHPTTRFAQQIVSQDRLPAPAAALTADELLIFPTDRCRAERAMRRNFAQQVEPLDLFWADASPWFVNAPQSLVQLPDNTTVYGLSPAPTSSRTAPPPIRVGQAFDVVACLLAIQTTAPLQSGAVTQMQLVWEPFDGAEGDYLLRTRLETAFGDPLFDLPEQIVSFDSTQQADPVFTSAMMLSLPDGIAPGMYRVVVELLKDYERLYIYGPGISPIAEIAHSDSFLIDSRIQSVAPLPDRPIFVAGEQIALHANTLEEATDGVQLQLVWGALRPIDTAYNVFIHIVDGDGNLLAQADGPPLGGRAPTTMWHMSDRIVDERIVSFDTQAGDYQIALGVYVLETGERLPLVGQSGNITDSFVLPK